MKVLTCRKHEIPKNRNVDCKFSEMNSEEKKYRVRYLWFRVRCVYRWTQFLVRTRKRFE